MNETRDRTQLALLAVENVSKTFDVGAPLMRASRRGVTAVSGVSLHLGAGESLGLVGESGSGKSTLARILLRLCEPSAGRVFFRGDDVTRADHRGLLPLRREVQIVLQDAGAALDPRMIVADVLDEPLSLHRMAEGEARLPRLRELLSLVELPEEVLGLGAHQLSGGQQQRLCIARALALNPVALVCDEALSGLDSLLKAQMANLLVELQAQLGLAYLFISHELSWVRHLTDRVAVMFDGRIVETGPTSTVLGEPRHPYTQSLLAAEPLLAPGRHRRLSVLATETSGTAPARGCSYASRCDRTMPRCRTEPPALQPAGDGAVACHQVAP